MRKGALLSKGRALLRGPCHRPAVRRHIKPKAAAGKPPGKAAQVGIPLGGPRGEVILNPRKTKGDSARPGKAFGTVDQRNRPRIRRAEQAGSTPARRAIWNHLLAANPGLTPDAPARPNPRCAGNHLKWLASAVKQGIGWGARISRTM